MVQTPKAHHHKRDTNTSKSRQHPRTYYGNSISLLLAPRPTAVCCVCAFVWDVCVIGLIVLLSYSRDAACSALLRDSRAGGGPSFAAAAVERDGPTLGSGRCGRRGPQQQPSASVVGRAGYIILRSVSLAICPDRRSLEQLGRQRSSGRAAYVQPQVCGISCSPPAQLRPCIAVVVAGADQPAIRLATISGKQP